MSSSGAELFVRRFQRSTAAFFDALGRCWIAHVPPRFIVFRHTTPHHSRPSIVCSSSTRPPQNGHGFKVVSTSTPDKRCNEAAVFDKRRDHESRKRAEGKRPNDGVRHFNQA